MPQIPSIAVGQFAPRTPRAGKSRQEQVKSAHEPTGDFSLSLTRMASLACQCSPQRKKKRLVNGGQLGYVSGIVGTWDVMDVMAGSCKSFFTAEPSALDAKIQRGTSPQSRGGPPHWASGHEQAYVVNTPPGGAGQRKPSP